jgi:hypothetical protein
MAGKREDENPPIDYLHQEKSGAEGELNPEE